jgi:ABC-2 type transport system permease protein
MPLWLQLISYAVPLRYFLIIARGIVLKGVDASLLWPEIAALAVFAVVIMGAAVARFRKSLD